jgi:hypothetical protein
VHHNVESVPVRLKGKAMILINLFLDAVVLYGIIFAMQGKDVPEFVHLLLVTFGIAVANGNRSRGIKTGIGGLE